MTAAALPGLRIRLWDEKVAPAIRAMNDRLESAGSSWKFYDEVDRAWIAPDPSSPISREFYVAQKGKDVHGGFVIKRQTFLLSGAEVVAANIQGPVSESIVRPDLKGLGGVMTSAAHEMEPYIFAWGFTPEKAKMLTRMAWPQTRVPMLLKTSKLGRILRRGRLAPKKVAPLAALASLTGLPQLAASIARPSRVRPGRAYAAPQEEFGPWADTIWDRAKLMYGFIATRDAKSLNRLMPAAGEPFVTPLKILRDNGDVIGWAAVRDRQLDDDPMFGNLRCGSIVDALAIPGCEALVANAATRWLEDKGVDLVGAVFSHPTWQVAFDVSGYWSIKDRRTVAASPALANAVGGLDKLLSGAHLTLIDGDGPRVF